MFDIFVKCMEVNIIDFVHANNIMIIIVLKYFLIEKKSNSVFELVKIVRLLFVVCLFLTSWYFAQPLRQYT